LSLLSKNIGNHFPLLEGSSLGWAIAADLTVAEEYELKEIRNDRRLKLKHSPTDIACLSHFTDLLCELVTSLLIRKTQMGEMFRLGWQIG
jgi:hypothetical protein